MHHARGDQRLLTQFVRFDVLLDKEIFLCQHLGRPRPRAAAREVPARAPADKRGAMRLRVKVAAITGGGRGIGRAAAELFACEGARVAILEVDEAR